MKRNSFFSENLNVLYTKELIFPQKPNVYFLYIFNKQKSMKNAFGDLPSKQKGSVNPVQPKKVIVIKINISDMFQLKPYGVEIVTGIVEIFRFELNSNLSN